MSANGTLSAALSVAAASAVPTAIYNITSGALSPLSPDHFNITNNGTIHLPGGITYGRLMTVGSDYRLARSFWVASLAVAVWDFRECFFRSVFGRGVGEGMREKRRRSASVSNGNVASAISRVHSRGS